MSPKEKYFHIGLGIFLAILILASSLYSIKTNTLYDQNFAYTANVYSLDNFYDATLGAFKGEQLSKTTFYYESIDQNQNSATIKNVFDVRTLQGEKIFQTEREYGIQPNTGKHIPSKGDKPREGYLFAPAGLNKGEDYTYWHVNYDNPAHMAFQREETIYELEVYKYKATYTADQTVDLSHLPGVPETRGIRLNITLYTWIEPETGWLIKYQDETTAYYYDQTTGEPLHPWNKFSNRFLEKSVRDQVAIAKSLKQKQTIPHFIIFGTLLLGLLILSIRFMFAKQNNQLHLKQPKTSKPLLTKFSILISLFIFTAFLLVPFSNHFIQEKQIVIGISPWTESHLPVVDAFKERLLEEYSEGEEIRFIELDPAGDATSQREIIKSLVDSEVDLIFTLTTPGTTIAKETTREIPLVFGIVTYPVETDLIDSLRSSGNNLVGIRNYIPPSKQFFYFEQLIPQAQTLAYIHRKNEQNSEIGYREFNNLLSKRNIKLHKISLTSTEELIPLLETYLSQLDGIILACDTLISQEVGVIALDFAKKHNLPTLACNEDTIRKGALIGVVANQQEQGKLAAEKALLILQGAKPRWISTESARNDYIILNTALIDRLNITLSERFIAQVNEVIKK